MKEFALVLGGGSTKGFAHIGILKVLEKYNLKPSLIVGTSMGALVGGLYCAGVSVKDMEDMAQKFNNIGTFSLYSTLFKGNLLNITKVHKILDKLLKDKTHESCDIKFVSVATVLNKGVEEHLDSGYIKDSIMASISIPAVFPRFKIGDKHYVDGGLLNNLPEDVVKEYLPNAKIISVDPIGDYSKQVEKLKLKTAETILNASTLMTQTIAQKKPKYADIRIVISQPTVSQMDFSAKTTKKAIANGENAIKKVIDDIKTLLGVKDEPKGLNYSLTSQKATTKEPNKIKKNNYNSKLTTKSQSTLTKNSKSTKSKKG